MSGFINQLTKWKKEQKAQNWAQRTNRRKKRKDLARINRKKNLEWKKMTSKQRKVYAQRIEIVEKSAIEIIHPFLRIFNKLKITHKIGPFSGMSEPRGNHKWHYRRWENTHCWRLSDFYSPKPEMPPKGNPRKPKREKVQHGHR